MSVTRESVISLAPLDVAVEMFSFAGTCETNSWRHGQYGSGLERHEVMRWVRVRTIGRATGSGSGWPRLVELDSAIGGICEELNVSADWRTSLQVRETHLARAVHGAQLPDVLLLPVRSKLFHQRLEPRISHPALLVDLESPSRSPTGDLLSSSSLVSVVDVGGGERGCCEDVLETKLPREDEHEQG